jgi:hypothetical protein
MAFLGGEADLPVWFPQPVPEDLLAGASIRLLVEEWAACAHPGDPAGFIILDWFGPFLLGPSSRLLRGRC